MWRNNIHSHSSLTEIFNDFHAQICLAAIFISGTIGLAILMIYKIWLQLDFFFLQK